MSHSVKIVCCFICVYTSRCVCWRDLVMFSTTELAWRLPLLKFRQWSLSVQFDFDWQLPIYWVGSGLVTDLVSALTELLESVCAMVCRRLQRVCLWDELLARHNDCIVSNSWIWGLHRLELIVTYVKKICLIFVKFHTHFKRTLIARPNSFEWFDCNDWLHLFIARTASAACVCCTRTMRLCNQY